MRRLVLWDIDGTLVDFSGLRSSIYANAFRTVTGMDLRRELVTTGRTEWAIVDDLLHTHGIPPTADLRRSVFDAIDRATEQAAPELVTHGRVLPGVAVMLTHLAHSHAVVQSLATGNTPAVARIKLEAVGLACHLNLDIGGFGTDSPHRPDIVKQAVARAAALLGAAPVQVIVVGDTPWDVKAARAHGAVAVGLATGKFTADDLCRAGASPCMANIGTTARRQILCRLLALSDTP